MQCHANVPNDVIICHENEIELHFRFSTCMPYRGRQRKFIPVVQS